MIKTKMIDAILMAIPHRQKTVKARKPTRMPSNGLKRTKQRETFQPESLAVEFVVMPCSQAVRDRYFRKFEDSCTWM
jgi:hypothetical protein